MGNPRGYTLIELVVVLALLGLLLALAVPPAARWRDGMAVRSARDDLAAALARTRIAAPATGGAALVLDPGTARFWIRTARTDSVDPVDLGERYGVTVESGSGGTIELPYDALGIGRLASRTLVFRRGRASSGLVISAYGRARRW